MRWKLFISYLLIGLIPLLFFLYSVTGTLEEHFSEQKKEELKSEAQIIATSISMSNYLFDKSKSLRFDVELEKKSTEGDFRILVFDSKSVVVNDSVKISGATEIGNMHIIPEVIEALNEEGVSRLLPDKNVIYTTEYISNEKGEIAGAVLLISSADFIDELIRDITDKFVILGILLGVIIIVLVFFISQLIIDPLKNILTVVQKMSEGHLSERIEISGSDEFANLSDAFNDMSDQLEKVEMSRQEFVSNVSHELKTPLSSMKVLGESLLLQEEVPNEMYREFLQDIISEVDRMANIINELLSLVKLDSVEQNLNIKQTKVNKVVEDILKRLQPLAEQRNIELLYDDVRPVVIDADEMRLSLAISNLVENGIKYSEDGGKVKVIVDSDHQNAFITVLDDGIGISEEDQSKIFVRFYRVDKTRDRETGGTGLGLAITHKTVLLHNGSIKITSKENEGTTFVIRLPIHQN